MSTRFEVVFEDFTVRHYIKNIVKRHSVKVWKITKTAIESMCANAEASIATDKFETISQNGDKLLCKLYFSIAGTGKSPKGSGNRCITVVDKEQAQVAVLLVYHKNDLGGTGSETVRWKRIIKDNYPEYGTLV